MNKLNFTDNEIISAIKNGSSNDVLKFLYKNIQPKTTKWILNNNGNKDEAQDIFQEAIVSFYQYVITNKFKPEYSISSFIFRICKNHWINRTKQINKNVAFNNEENIATPIEEVKSPKKENELNKVLSLLGNTCKQLLTYSIFYDLSMEDISIRMNMSNANTAKTKNYKCKKRLMKLIKENKQVKETLYS